MKNGPIFKKICSSKFQGFTNTKKCANSAPNGFGEDVIESDVNINT